MESHADGAFLARLTLAMIRNTGGFPVAVMTDRSFVQLRARERLELGEVAGSRNRGACLMPGRHQTGEQKKEGAQDGHCRPAVSQASEGSCTPCALYTSLLQLSQAHFIHWLKIRLLIG